jgi:hypothetical protein
MNAEPEPSRIGRLILAGFIACVIVGGLVGGLLVASRRGVSPREVRGHTRTATASQWNSAVETFLREHANDPGSVQIVDVKYLRTYVHDQPADLLIWVSFRERNRFGATEYREMVLSTDGSRLRRDDDFLRWRGMDGWSKSPQ